MGAEAKADAMNRHLLPALALVFVLLLASAAGAAAQGSSAGAQAAVQDPDTPTGEPQPGGEEEPTDEVPEPETPVEEAPVTPGDPGATAPGTSAGGTLPHTGLETLWIALAGVALLLLGARLRVLTRIREVVRRLRTPKVALRESLEELRAAGVEEDRRAALRPPPVEPTTPGARRTARS